MNQTVLITGICGFAGRAMYEYLRSVQPDLIQVGADVVVPRDKICDYFYQIDVSDFEQVHELMGRHRPDYVLHFAGSFGTEDSVQIYRVNVLSVVALLEAVRQRVPKSVFIAVGSAAEYGHVSLSDLPVQENLACHPVTPYGLSKYLATQTVQYYARIHGLGAMVVRPFQLIGRGVTDRLAPGAFAKRLREAVTEGKHEICVGNVETTRDFLDIRDAVRAIWMLCRNPAPGEIFNLCAGRPIRIKDLLGLMIKVCGKDIRSVTAPSCVKGNTDVNVIYGSFNKVNRHCGWAPSVSLEDSIREMLSDIISL